MQLKNKILCVFFAISVLASCDQVEQFVSLQFKNELILSPEMEKRIPVVVITPKTYEDDGNIEKEYPVVYLLHGYSGDQNQWKKITNLPAIADKYDVLLVCPDAGYDSWYFDSPVDPKFRYETFIMQNVMAHIDSAYRTKGAKARAITGLSMGGHGALRFMATYPDSFVAAGSMSGILDLRQFPSSWNMTERLGPMIEHPKRWMKNSAVHFVQQLKNRSKGIIVDCGVDDFAIGVNRAMRDSAAVHGVDIQFEEFPGAHSHEYWASRLDPHIAFLQQYFRKR